MAYDFPNTPALDDSVTTPAGVTFVWDGVKWTGGASSGGGGGMAEPVGAGTWGRLESAAWNKAQPLMGVVDGSNAGPGEVGEFLKVDPPVRTGFPLNDTAYACATLSIPPGEWLVWANCTFQLNVGVSPLGELLVWIGVSNVPPQPWVNLDGFARLNVTPGSLQVGSVSLSPSPFRMVLTAQTSVSLFGQGTWTTPDISNIIDATLYALRVR